jgi:hypothetical protein
LPSSDEDRGRAVELRQEPFHVLDLRQVVVNDVGIGGIADEKILVILLRRIEAVGFDLGDDRF